MSETKRGAGQSARPAGGLSAQHTGCAGAKPATERSDRRGAVILLQRGDPEISGAIAEGMQAARKLPREQVEVVEAEIDRQRLEAFMASKFPALPETADGRIIDSSAAPTIVASLVRVAVGNDKTPEDYSLMMTKVRGDCARYSRAPGPVGRALRRVLGWYGLLCWAVAGAYRSQDRLLGGRRA